MFFLPHPVTQAKEPAPLAAGKRRQALQHIMNYSAGGVNERCANSASSMKKALLS